MDCRQPRNPGLVNGYRAAGLIVFAYGIYTVCIGCLNGRKLFIRQAQFDLVFTTLKACLVLGFAAMGFGVIGAFFGFATAAVLITLIALVVVARKLESGPSEPALFAYAAQVMLYTIVFNLIFKLDGVLLNPHSFKSIALPCWTWSRLFTYWVCLLSTRSRSNPG